MRQNGVCHLVCDHAVMYLLQFFFVMVFMTSIKVRKQVSGTFGITTTEQSCSGHSIPISLVTECD